MMQQNHDDHDHHHHGHDHHGHGDHVHEHHGHAHGHLPPSFGSAFAIGVGLNSAFVVCEIVFGLWSNSVALLADAGHNLGDVLGLLAAWSASILVMRAPSIRFTYGLKGSSILAALFNGVILLVAVGGISWEAVQRIFDPQPVAGRTVMVVAAIGILVNGFTAWLFAAGRQHDLNMRGAFLHMLSDAMVSAGVIVAALVMLVTGWLWLDPLVSLAINAVIIAGTWGLMRDALGMSMAAVPARIDPVAVRHFLEARNGVASLHDLHIWSMSTTETALTCHLVIPDGHPGDAFLHDLCADLSSRFGIGHSTVQIETDPETICPLAPEHVV